jgi:3-oxoacyl-[acyl-carrier protein] reductase
MTDAALAGRKALVTGASRGIGRAIAVELACQGASVALVARTEQALQEVAEEVRQSDSQAFPLALDVSDSAAVTATVQQAVEQLGGLDILVNNAGVTRDGLLIRMSDDDWDQVVNVDLRAVFTMCRAAARALRKSSAGRIINISSVVGLLGNAGQVNYAAAKAGLHGLTWSLAKELGGKGVTVNAVCPGFIETDMTSGLGDELRQRVLQQVPVARFGQPEDIARTVAFLASSSAGYVSGAIIPVDGGMSLGKIG